MTGSGQRPAGPWLPPFTSGNRAIIRFGNLISVSWAGMLACPAAASSAATSEESVTRQPCITKLSPSSHRDGLSPSGESGSLPRNLSAMPGLLPGLFSGSRSRGSGLLAGDAAVLDPVEGLFLGGCVVGPPGGDLDQARGHDLQAVEEPVDLGLGAHPSPVTFGRVQHQVGQPGTQFGVG